MTYNLRPNSEVIVKAIIADNIGQVTIRDGNGNEKYYKVQQGFDISIYNYLSPGVNEVDLQIVNRGKWQGNLQLLINGTSVISCQGGGDDLIFQRVHTLQSVTLIK